MDGDKTEPLENFETWLLHRVAQAVEAAEIPADLLTELQAEIEEHLHEARTLVGQALEAAERGDNRQVERLLRQVRVHTTQAIEASKEQKK